MPVFMYSAFVWYCSHTTILTRTGKARVNCLCTDMHVYHYFRGWVRVVLCLEISYFICVVDGVHVTAVYRVK